MADIVNRIDGKLIRIDAEWGTAIDPRALNIEIKGRKHEVVAVVQCRKRRPVYASPLRTWPGSATTLVRCFWWTLSRRWGVCGLVWIVPTSDAVYSGTRGIYHRPSRPFAGFFSRAAGQGHGTEKIPRCPLWFLDSNTVSDYWGSERKYHHTAPINPVYSLREALRLIAEEGLEMQIRAAPLEPPGPGCRY